MGSSSLADMLNDCSIDRLMAIDSDWRIIAWNKTSELLSGVSKKEVIGQPLLAVFPLLATDEEIMSAIQAAFDGRKSFVPAHKDLFNRHFYENHFIPLRDEQNKLIGVMNIMHDVAHREKAEQQLQNLNLALEKKYRQLERAADEQATFTYVTSHNIKEPLRLVYSSLELLIRAEAKQFSDGGKANVRRIQASLNRMNLMLDDILNLSRINTFQQSETQVNLNEIVAQVKEALQAKLQEKEAVIEVGILPDIHGYKDMLHFLLLNLIDNAIKFQYQNHQPLVTITCEEITSPELYTRLTVTDNGIGFEASEATNIFTMFEKLNGNQYVGSGTGLAICRKIMDAHNGYIEATATLGQGATFHCYFPLTPGN